MNDSKRPQTQAHFRQTNVGRPPVAPTLKLDSIYEIQGKWRRRGADVRLVVSCIPGEFCRLEIDFLGIPKASRSKGYGSKLLQELMKAADSRKLDILLTPEGSDRSERSRRFFERHGFKLANGEDGPYTWMVRKTGRRAEQMVRQASSVQKEAEKPKVTSLFMENAAKFKRGCKDVLAEYGGVGKVDHCASGSKVYYGFYTGEKDQRRPPYPTNVPEGHFALWNEDRREYEFFPKKEAYGGVVFNDKGEILLRLIASHMDGANIWTFSSGRPAGDEITPENAARLEIREETGVEAKILSELPASFEGDTAYTRFYIMRMVSEGHPMSAQTVQIAWLKPEDAKNSISQTPDEKAKQRDLAVLEAALKYAKEAFEEEIRKSFLIFYTGMDEGSEAEESEASERGPEPSGRDVQNALIYWGNKQNRSVYPAKEQYEILTRILAAAQRQGIDPEFLKAQ